jgi:cytidine deaminase
MSLATHPVRPARPDGATLAQLAAEWRAARRLYPIYLALVQQFDLGMPPSKELEHPMDRTEPAAIERVRRWFSGLDERIPVYQLRQLLQTTHLGSQENLQALIARHLEKERKTESDRDKLDFLLVQYFTQSAPPEFHNRIVTLEDVAEILEPVLGESSLNPPAWLSPLERDLEALEACESLRQIFAHGILEQGRRLKTQAGEMYFGSAVLLAFTRYNFLVRRAFFRCMHADLHAIRFALRQLEQRGVETVDCTRAQLSEQEPLGACRQLCHDWKKPFQAAYSAGRSFAQLLEVRSAVEHALTLPPPAPRPVAEPPLPEPAPPIVEHAAVIALPPAPEPKKEELPVVAPAAPAAVEKEIVAAPPATAKPAPKRTPAAKVALAKPAVAKAPEAPAPPSSSAPDLQGCLEFLAEMLFREAMKPGTVTATLQMGSAKLMLSSWEVAAFVRGGDEVSDALQRVVAARALLFQGVEKGKRGQPAPLAVLLQMAHAEAARSQEQVARAKDARNIDAAVNLAASGKRLLALMEEAEKLAS